MGEKYKNNKKIGPTSQTGRHSRQMKDWKKKDHVLQLFMCCGFVLFLLLFNKVEYLNHERIVIHQGKVTGGEACRNGEICDHFYNTHYTWLYLASIDFPWLSYDGCCCSKKLLFCGFIDFEAMCVKLFERS